MQYTAGGLTATGTSGSLVYTAASGPAEEVRLDIAITAGGGTYTAYLLAGTTDLSTANLRWSVGIDQHGVIAGSKFGMREQIEPRVPLCVVRV